MSEEEAPLPKDRNARIREEAARTGLLKKQTVRERESTPLTADEMMGDALARGADAAWKWHSAKETQSFLNCSARLKNNNIAATSPSLAATVNRRWKTCNKL